MDWLAEAERWLGTRSGYEAGGETDNKVKNDTVAFNTIETEPITPLDYAPGSEHHHLTMSMLGGHGCRL